MSNPLARSILLRLVFFSPVNLSRSPSPAYRNNRVNQFIEVFMGSVEKIQSAFHLTPPGSVRCAFLAFAYKACKEFI